MNREERKAQALVMAEQLKAGMTQGEIARHYGLDRQTVKARLDSLGLPPRKRGQKIFAEATEVQRQVAEAFKAGATMAEIGAARGVSRQRIHQILEKSGLAKLDGGHRKFKQGRSEAVLDLAYQGHDLQSISAAIGVSKVAVQGYLSRAGTSILSFQRMRREEQQKRICELRSKGAKRKEIADSLGIPLPTVDCALQAKRCVRPQANRAELTALFKADRDAGMLQREIAEKHGYTLSWVSQVLNSSK